MTTDYVGPSTGILDFRTAISTILTPLFSGTSHYLGDVSQVIPAAKISTLHQIIEPPTEMTIYITGDGAIYDEERYKTADPVDPTKRAIQVRGKIERSIHVVTPLDKLVAGKRRQDIDAVWSALYGIFLTRHQQFTPYGIYFPTIPMLPIDIQTNPLFIEAYGTFRAELRTIARPYTLNL